MPNDALNFDVPCAGCRYNLRGLSVSGQCPECGKPVMETLRAHVEHSDLDRAIAASLSQRSVAFLRTAKFASTCALIAHVAGWSCVVAVNLIGMDAMDSWAGVWVVMLLVSVYSGAAALIFAGFAKRTEAATSGRWSGRFVLLLWVSAGCSVALPFAHLAWMMSSGGRWLGEGSELLWWGPLVAVMGGGVILRWLEMQWWLRAWGWRRLGWSLVTLSVLGGFFMVVTTVTPRSLRLGELTDSTSAMVRAMSIPAGSGGWPSLTGEAVKSLIRFRGNLWRLDEFLVMSIALGLSVALVAADVVVFCLARGELRRRSRHGVKP